MAFFQSAAPKTNLHLAGDRCPTCDQVIPNDRLDDVRERVEARNRQLQAEADTRARAEVDRIRAESAAAQDVLRADAAKREAALRVEIEASASAAAAQKVQQVSDALAAAEKSVSDLKAAQEAAVAARVAEVRDAMEAAKIAAVHAEQAKHFEDSQKTKRLVEELQRKLQNKTAEELGEGAEVDLFEALKAEFPDDIIRRVGRGNAGADVIHEVRHSGAACGKIVYDSKNHGAWRSDHAAKLREDQLAEKAEHAVLSTRKFPAGAAQLHIENGVILTNPARAVIVARLLRRQIVQLYILKASTKERSRKSDELYSFITSDRFEQFVATIQRAAADLDDLQVEERKAHEKTWRRQGEMVAKLKKATSAFDEAVERIIAASSVVADGEEPSAP